MRYPILAFIISAAAANAAEPELFPGDRPLERTRVIELVLERNPGIAAAREGWRAALANERRQSAWENPMVSYGIAPRSIGSDVPFGQELEISQALPITGKLSLQRAVARAEADAARADFGAVRQRLAAMASQIYDDYCLAERSLHLHAQYLELVDDFKRGAEARLAAGGGSVQDPLQAAVELAEMEQEQITLISDRDVAAAQLNGLLHRLPQDPLPDPPYAAPPAAAPDGDVAALQESALRARPDVVAARSRAHVGASAVALARREYLPEFAVTGSYNSMWMDEEHQVMVGVSASIPLQYGRIRGAVDEARANSARSRQELARVEDEVRVEVAQAFARVAATRKIVASFADHLLPAARSQLAAARIGFEANRGDFSMLISAEKNLRGIEIRHLKAVADLSRNAAALAQAIGQAAPEGNQP